MPIFHKMCIFKSWNSDQATFYESRTSVFAVATPQQDDAASYAEGEKLKEQKKAPLLNSLRPN